MRLNILDDVHAFIKVFLQSAKTCFFESCYDEAFAIFFCTFMFKLELNLEYNIYFHLYI